MELGNGFGDKIKTLYCSDAFPCVFGEESLVLGLANPFTYVSKTPVIMIKFNLDQFFSIIEKTGPKSIAAYKKRSEEKIKRLT
jgi:hypothetical protein